MSDDYPTDHLNHLAWLTSAYQGVAETQGYEALLLYSGAPRYHHADDQAATFRTYAHFLHWVPLPGVSHSWLWIRPGNTPVLYLHAPDDFWHLSPQLPDAPWTSRFDIRLTVDTRPSISPTGRLAILGDVPADLAQRLGGELNPPRLVRALDELRVRKTAYEIDCIRDANRLALAGHRAAHDAFETGAAELDIQLAYLGASRQRESDVPYQNIIGLNRHAGVLHYQHYDLQPPASYSSLLVDAGRSVAGYASDITRTWAGSDADARFSALIHAMEAMQQRLIEAIRPGVSFIVLHRRMHQELGKLLIEHGLTRCSEEAAVESGITRAFCPHGLGHLLGLQVHDVGGRVASDGQPLPAPESDPALRLTRELEAEMVVTVEPGLYFIPLLLDPLRETPTGRHIEWALVDALAGHGGIRIEDNIRVAEAGHENLTRIGLAH
ncbi:Xaa-Pro dipeptidase [Halomonas sp. McH1-25]|uniref:Xaa-Pro dipeptidase n=2 Tax=Halomonas TaxID=2745 RepID=UPI001EF46A09|nr:MULTISPECIES: Xaa-Pro dipeptidase [unclassified Halomonas]MCG7598479.1 Xaa-Pro dipeptidase [Halomonas sp. McH1-25]MCP1343440.1 Xaa-Pro dipeptidase [Halomonas sp. FL8]